MSYEKKGVAVSHGFVSGNIILINQARTIVEKKKITKSEIYTEINRLQTALELSLKEISELKNSSSYGLKSEHIDILDFNILVLEDEIIITHKDGVLICHEIQIPNKRRMKSKEILNGNHLKSFLRAK